MLSVLGSDPNRSLLNCPHREVPVEEQPLVRPQQQIPVGDDAIPMPIDAMLRVGVAGWGIASQVVERERLGASVETVALAEGDRTGGRYHYIHAITVKNLINLWLRLESAQCSAVPLSIEVAPSCS